jgi:hypothetical protein
MDKERLKELFGKFGDRKEFLEQMFKDAFLDHVDDSEVLLDNDLNKTLELHGMKVAYVNHLIERSVEGARILSCDENQKIIINHLKKFIGGEPGMEFEDGWAVRKHMDTCLNRKCEELDTISLMDKRLTPEQMKISFGNIINNWEESS